MSVIDAIESIEKYEYAQTMQHTKQSILTFYEDDRFQRLRTRK